MSQINELSNMQVFMRVVKEGSFSATARVLGISPSAVSRQISQLEKELSIRLFSRTTRKQQLTDAGKLYLDHAHSIIDELASVKTRLQELAKSPSGVLKVTAEADFATVFLAPILQDFLAIYPDIQIRLMMNTHLLDLINGGVDMAIRLGHLEDSSLIARKIGESQSLVCASPDYLHKHGIPQTPDDLSHHNCLSFKIDAGKRIWQFKDNNQTYNVEVAGRVYANNLSFIRNIALLGQGIIMVPEWLVRQDFHSGKLQAILTDYTLQPAGLPINAVFANSQQMPVKMRVFIDFLVERIGHSLKHL
ncbi:LysR substrate-binding domain-containing protein [Glaciecola sp. 1036]|uniref:LysR family transcriptional regulator n=1 Tax=Alteromonadaceae TaxID=72275 RepID=UPI003D01D470